MESTGWVPHAHLAAVLAAVCLVIGGCSEQPQRRPTSVQAHPLTGTIWDLQTGASIGRDRLEAVLIEAPFLVLGEIHDNPDHHRLQLELLDVIARSGRRPALVMEMFDREHQAAIDTARTRNADADDLAKAGRLERRCWHWPFYRPLVQHALKSDLPLQAANLSRAATREIVQKGVDAMDADLREPDVGRLLSAQADAAQRAELVEGHCGHSPAAMLPGLVAAQRARDLAMTRAMLMHAERGAILIAGSGHGRTDYAVPRVLRHLLPSARTISVAFVEVESTQTRLDDYLPTGSAATYDYVWFTRRTEREDPCKGFKMPGGRAIQ